MKRSGVDMQFDWHTPSHQPARVVDILFQEEVEGTRCNESARQSTQVLCAGRGGINRNVGATGRLAEQATPAETIVVRSPDEL